MRWWTLLVWMVRGDRPGHTAHRPARDPTQRAGAVRADHSVRGEIDEDESIDGAVSCTRPAAADIRHGGRRQ
jgi:hypothetical protein